MRLRSLTLATVLAVAATTLADTFKFANSASTIEFTVTRKDVSHSGRFRKIAKITTGPTHREVCDTLWTSFRDGGSW